MPVFGGAGSLSGLLIKLRWLGVDVVILFCQKWLILTPGRRPGTEGGEDGCCGGFVVGDDTLSMIDLVAAGS